VQVPLCSTSRISPVTCCCDERRSVERALERAEPQAVVDQLGPALLDAALEAGQVALDGEVSISWCAVMSTCAPGTS
jgi:hypothetical protein